jgi:hypothetical protein
LEESKGDVGDNFEEIHGYDNKFVDIQKELNLKAIQ